MDLFIRKIALKDDIKPSLFDSYPLNISALNFFVSITLKKPVTIFNGENGCGKSTIIEALADSFNLSIAGGNNNMYLMMEQNRKEQKPLLSDYLWIDKGFKRPRRAFFFRAESFYDVASAIDDSDKHPEEGTGLIKSNYLSKDLLKQSHGQSFIDIIEHQLIDDNLYLMDEPEAALSPSNQIKLLKLINKYSKRGCQFIIATHSPLLLGCKDASIVNLDDGMKNIRYKDTKVYKLYKDFMDNPEIAQTEEDI